MKINGKMMVAVVMMVGSLAAAGCNTASASDSGPVAPEETAATAPVDNGIVSQMIAAIDGATTSVHMTMYILDNNDVITALVNRHKAGVDVRVILNETFPAGGNTSNSNTFSTLQAAGDGQPGLRHGYADRDADRDCPGVDLGEDRALWPPSTLARRLLKPAPNA